MAGEIGNREGMEEGARLPQGNIRGASRMDSNFKAGGKNSAREERKALFCCAWRVRAGRRRAVGGEWPSDAFTKGPLSMSAVPVCGPGVR